MSIKAFVMIVTRRYGCMVDHSSRMEVLRKHVGVSYRQYGRPLSLYPMTSGEEEEGGDRQSQCRDSWRLNDVACRPVGAKGNERLLLSPPRAWIPTYLTLLTWSLLNPSSRKKRNNQSADALSIPPRSSYIHKQILLSAAAEAH